MRGRSRRLGGRDPARQRLLPLSLAPVHAANVPMPAKKPRKMIQRPISWKSMKLVCSITLIVCTREKRERRAGVGGALPTQRRKAVHELRGRGQVARRSGRTARERGVAFLLAGRRREASFVATSRRTNLVERDSLLEALGGARDQEELEEELVRRQGGGETERVVQRHLGAGGQRDVVEELRERGGTEIERARGGGGKRRKHRRTARGKGVEAESRGRAPRVGSRGRERHRSGGGKSSVPSRRRPRVPGGQSRAAPPPRRRAQRSPTLLARSGGRAAPPRRAHAGTHVGREVEHVQVGVVRGRELAADNGQVDGRRVRVDHAEGGLHGGPGDKLKGGVVGKPGDDLQRADAPGEACARREERAGE